MRKTAYSVVLIALLAVSSAACSSAPDATEDDVTAEPEAVEEDHEHHDDHDHHGDHDHHDHRFEDPEEYAERWNDPARDEWQQPEAIIEEMGLEEGMVVADIGAGTGYFIPFLSEAVGDEGEVIAVDIEPEMLAYIEALAEEEGLENVSTRQAEGASSGLEEGEVDRVITVNTWHHIPARGEYSGHLKSRLNEGGSVWVVDFHEESPMGPPAHHRLAPEQVLEELGEGGLQGEVKMELERQYLIGASESQ